MTERLGPPPHDLNERELPIVRLEGPWLRLHAVRREPIFFGTTGLNRFDDPEGEYGVFVRGGGRLRGVYRGLRARPGPEPRGRGGPVQALAEYRRATSIPAKLVVVGMTATGSTIGDPQDAGVLDVVGLSTDTPRLIADFIRG